MAAVPTLCGLLLLAALLHPAASAAACTGPPGVAGLDQYCEQVPGPGGNEAPGAGSGGGDGRAGGGGTGTGSESAIPADTQRYLESHGAGGLAGIAGGPGKSQPKGDGAPQLPAQSNPSDNPLSAVSSAVDNSGSSVSGLFIWLLIALALVLFGIAWMRFRRNTPGTSGGTPGASSGASGASGGS